MKVGHKIDHKNETQSQTQAVTKKWEIKGGTKWKTKPNLCSQRARGKVRDIVGQSQIHAVRRSQKRVGNTAGDNVRNKVENKAKSMPRPDLTESGRHT